LVYYDPVSTKLTTAMELYKKSRGPFVRKDERKKPKKQVKLGGVLPESEKLSD